MLVNSSLVLVWDSGVMPSGERFSPIQLVSLLEASNKPSSMVLFNGSPPFLPGMVYGLPSADTPVTAPVLGSIGFQVDSSRGGNSGMMSPVMAPGDWGSTGTPFTPVANSSGEMGSPAMGCPAG